jgi:hypothetical protein
LISQTLTIETVACTIPQGGVAIARFGGLDPIPAELLHSIIASRDSLHCHDLGRLACTCRLFTTTHVPPPPTPALHHRPPPTMGTVTQ